MSASKSLRARIYHLIDNEEEQDFASQTFEVIITFLILLSIVCIILESFAHLREQYGTYFDLFENATLGIFTVEYLLRVFTADFKFPEAKSWSSAAWRFIRSGTGIVDLIAISPLFFMVLGALGAGAARIGDLRFVRILKITRLFRIFKMNSFTSSVAVVAEVFAEKRHDLGITIFVTFILLLVSATIMWYVEGEVQPDAFPNIIASFWWAIATLTTVGYGDVYPVTPLGKFLSGSIALLGIGLVALPAGILSSAFIEKLENGIGSPRPIEPEEPTQKSLLPQAQFQTVVGKKDDNRKEESAPLASTTHDCQAQFGQAFVYCPYCGKKLDEHPEH